MQVHERHWAKLALVSGIMGMTVQERLSLMPGNVTKSAALLMLALSVGLLIFAHGASFRAGYEEGRRRQRFWER